MNSRTYLITVLALTTVGGAALAWREYQELSAARAAAGDPNDRASMRNQIQRLKKENHELKDQLAALRAGKSANSDVATLKAPGQRADNAGRRFRGPFGARAAAFREAMAKPEVQALIHQAQAGFITSRYGPLFRSLNLTPDQQAKLADLIAQRQDALRDVAAAAWEQGVNRRSDPQGFGKLVSDAEAPINDSIKSLIGDGGFDQLTNYDQTLPQRNIVNALQQRLSYTESPLSATQADQLVQILAANSPTHANGNVGYAGMQFGGGRGPMGAMMIADGAGIVVGPGAAPITSEAVSQAQSVLSQPQIQALQQFQQQQQAAHQLQQLVREGVQQAETANSDQGGAGGGAQPAVAGGTPAGTGSSGAGRRRGGG